MYRKTAHHSLYLAYFSQVGVTTKIKARDIVPRFNEFSDYLLIFLQQLQPLPLPNLEP